MKPRQNPPELIIAVVAAIAVTLALLAPPAHAGFSLFRFGGRDQTGLVVNNDKECKSVTEIGGAGNAIVNLLADLEHLDGEAGTKQPHVINYEGNTVNRSTDADVITDLIRQAQSDYTKAGADAQSAGGEKNKTGNTTDTQVGANQVKTGTEGSPAPAGSTPADDGSVTFTAAQAADIRARLEELEALKTTPPGD